MGLSWDGRELKIKYDGECDDEDLDEINDILDDMLSTIEIAMEETVQRLNKKFPDAEFKYEV